MNDSLEGDSGSISVDCALPGDIDICDDVEEWDGECLDRADKSSGVGRLYFLFGTYSAEANDILEGDSGSTSVNCTLLGDVGICNDAEEYMAERKCLDGRDKSWGFGRL
jgi:hypothetical protein